MQWYHIGPDSYQTLIQFSFYEGGRGAARRVHPLQRARPDRHRVVRLPGRQRRPLCHARQLRQLHVDRPLGRRRWLRHERRVRRLLDHQELVEPDVSASDLWSSVSSHRLILDETSRDCVLARRVAPFGPRHHPSSNAAAESHRTPPRNGLAALRRHCRAGGRTTASSTSRAACAAATSSPRARTSTPTATLPSITRPTNRPWHWLDQRPGSSTVRWCVRGLHPPRLWSGPLNPRRSDNRERREERQPRFFRSASERARATPAPPGCPSSIPCGCYWALGVAMVSAHPRSSSRPRTPAEAKCELGRMRAVTSQIAAHCLLLGPTTVWRARRCSTQGAPSAYLCVCVVYGFRRFFFGSPIKAPYVVFF